MSEADRKKNLKEAYDQAWVSFSTFQLKAKEDIRAVNRHAWTEKDLLKMQRQKREPMTFPLIRRNVNWISGYQREHLLSIKYDPVEDADELTAGQLTAIGTWVFQHSNYYFTSSDAFEFALKGGINLINTFNEPNGDTSFDRFGYNQFVLDPTFRSRTLKDCQFGILRKHVNKSEAKILLPDKKGHIESINEADGGFDQDEMFTNFRRPTRFGSKLLAYDEFSERTTKQQKYLIIKPINKEILWPGTDAELKEQIRFLVQEMQIPANFLSVITRTERTVKVTAWLDGEEMWSETDPWGIGDFSFTPVMAYFDPDADELCDRVQGVVRLLKDSQRASDQRMMSMMSIFDQQAGAGLDYEEGALVDDDDAFATQHGQPRQFVEGAITNNRFRDRVIPDIPGGMFQLHETFDKNMPKMININEEMFGVPPKGKMQIAGMLAKLRVGTGLIGQRGLLHNFSLSTKIIGGKALKLFQQYTPEKVKRIINEDPAPGFKTHNFGKYDAVAAEGMLTDTQNNQMYAELVAMKEMGAKIGEPFPVGWSKIIEFMPVQAKLKRELLETIQKQEQQAQQAQQKQQQMQDLLQQLAIQQAQGQILEDRAQAEERRTQSVENTTGASLDRINTMTKTAELQQNIQLDPILKLLDFALELEKIKQQNVEAKVKS